MVLGAIKKPLTDGTPSRGFSYFYVNQNSKSMTKIEEIWKPIYGYENYQVSNTGLVKNNSSWKVLNKNTIGKYHGVTLCKSSQHRKMQLIHRLVAKAFIPNPDNKPQINHIDGNKLNNHVSNLEWCTASENSIHSYKLGLSTPSKNNLGNFGAKAHRRRAVIAYKKNGEFVGNYPTIRQAAKVFNISEGSIWNCINGRSKSGFGFIWKYA